MIHAVEILKLGSDPSLPLEEKVNKVHYILNNVISTLELKLMFLEDSIKEVIREWV